MSKQTTFKKFVLPVLFILVSQSSILPSQADQEDFSRFLLKVSLKKTYTEAISMNSGYKSADWFIKKSKKGNSRKIENLVNKEFLKNASALSNKLYPKGAKLAVDTTKIPVYSKSKSKYITKSSAEKGTTSFFQFLGFSIAERQLKFPVTFRLLEKDDSGRLHDILNESLSRIKNSIKIKLVILDRGFISSKIVHALQSLDLSFIIAFKRYQKIKPSFCLAAMNKFAIGNAVILKGAYAFNFQSYPFIFRTGVFWMNHRRSTIRHYSRCDGEISGRRIRLLKSVNSNKSPSKWGSFSERFRVQSLITEALLGRLFLWFIRIHSGK